MTNTFKQKLLLGTAIVAVAGFTAGAAHAVELGAGANANITTDDLAGIIESGGQTGTVTVDAEAAGTLNLGTNAGVASVTTNGTTTITITETTPAGGDTVHFDGDIVEQTGGVLTINLVAGDATINGNVTSAVDHVAINLGAAGGATTDALTINSDGNESLTIDAIIQSVEAADTTSLTILNGGNEAANTITFLNTLGGDGTANQLIDTVTIGADTAGEHVNVVFQGNVYTGGIAVSTGNVQNGTYNLTFGNTTTATTVSGDITNGGAGDTVTLAVANSANVTFNGTTAGDVFSVGTGSTATLSGATNAYTGTSTVAAGGKLNVFGDASNMATLNLVGSDSILTLGSEAATGQNTTTHTGNITGHGVLVLTSDDADAVGQTVDGNVGASSAGNTLTRVSAASDVANGRDVHTINGNLYTTNVDFGTSGTTTVGSADAILDLTGNDAAINIGSVTTQVNNEGTLRITGAGGTTTTATLGSAGTTTRRINDIELVATDDTINLGVTGSLYGDRITLEDNADVNKNTITFNGTTTQTIDMTIDSATADNEGVIVVGGVGTKSDVTFNKALGTTLNNLESFTVNSGSRAVFAGATNDFDSALTVDGTLRLNQATTTDVGSLAAGAALGSLEFVIGTTTGGVDNAAKLTSTGAINWDLLDGTTANSQKVNLVRGTGVVLNNQEFFIINGTGNVTGSADNLTALGNGTEIVSDEYALFDFVARLGTADNLAGTDASDVSVRATHVRGEDVTGNKNNSEAAEGILGVTVAQYARDNGDGRNELALVYDNVTRANHSEVDERLESIQSTVDGGNVVAATTVANITSNIIQLASTGAEGSGIAAGNISNGLRAWAQVFGQTGDQSDRDSIDGYDIDTFGFAVGLDTQALADQMVLGLAFSYADSEVDSDNANNTNTEIDTYQITLYGTYNIDEATYLSGQLGYAFGDNSTHREDLGGVAAVDADGDFDSNQFIARLEAGRAYEVGAITTLTPKLMVNYNYYDADSYRETGAGGAGLNVDQDTNHILEIGAGVDADWMFQQADGSYVKPQVRAGVRYDLADDEIEATNRLIGGGNAFKTEGFDPQSLAVDLGAGVTYFSTTNWELTANYDFEYKEDYHSHAGFLRAAYKF